MSEYKSSGTIQPRLEARHRISGLNSQFYGDHLEFAAYVQQCRELLSRARSALNTANLEKIVEGNVPFELKPSENYPTGQKKAYKRGILLVHGLTDSPYFMRHLAGFYQENGFRVMAVLLPGHGTQPGDLLDVNWQEWAKAAAYGVDRLDAEVDQIYLAGYSAGGTLSLYQSMRDSRVQGLFLFAPALKISPKAAWANWHKFYSWLIPSSKWVSILPDRDIYKYESLPKNAAAQMHALIQKVNQQLLTHQVNVPVFSAASADDATTAISATLNFMSRIIHPNKKLVLYTSDETNHTHGFPEEKLASISGKLPEQRILSYAHTSIVLPAEDVHYGKSGEYSNAAHYYPGEMEKYLACNNQPNLVLQGEITPKNLAAGTMRRLMYNPHFAALKSSMQQFIDELPDNSPKG